MTTGHLDIGCWNYDRVQGLRNGSIKLDGVDIRCHSATVVTEIFEAVVRRRAYDAAELGMTYYLRTFEQGRSPYLAIPVFLNRCFRHSAIYVSARSGIERPEDLVDRTIGELALYGHDSGLMSKGVLMDEFGFRPERNRWIVGRLDFPMDPIDFVPHPHPDSVSVTWSPASDLGAMLEAGEIDALFSADIPRCVLDGSPNVRRLFPDAEAVERDFYRRTGIFPIMHTVVVKRALAERQPEVVGAVYKGFCDAKDQASEALVRGMTFNNMATMVPWTTPLLERDRALLGNDWWPYGIDANRGAIDSILRYHHEQGLTDRRLEIEDVFVPALLDT